MTKLTNIIPPLAVVLLLISGYAVAEDKPQVSWGQLTTQQERLEHHEKLKNAKSVEERRKIQEEHQVLMRQRAEARGAQLRGQAAGQAQDAAKQGAANKSGAAK